MLDFLVGVTENLSQRKLDYFEMGFQHVEIGVAEAREQMILRLGHQVLGAKCPGSGGKSSQDNYTSIQCGFVCFPTYCQESLCASKTPPVGRARYEMFMRELKETGPRPVFRHA
jgi:hypothetical protein